MVKKIQITWLDRPQEHDYTAAMSYLNLLYDKQTTVMYVNKLRRAPMTAFKSRDIFRASGLSLLGIGNSHVVRDKKKILSKQKLSPILLVRDSHNGKVIIADGYHRMCAVYSYDEDAVVPCKII